MKTLQLIALSFILALTVGCASKVQYGDAQAVETVDTNFGSTDLQQIAEKMADSLLSFPPMVQITQKGRQVILMDRIKNKTVEHIDTESVTDTIVNKLLRSGQYQFVDVSNLEAVRSQISYQQNSGLVDPAKAVEIGKQTGAKFMLYGNLSSITKNSDKEKDVYYKFTMKLMNLETGILEWQDEKEIRKNLSRSMFGL